MRLYVGCLYTTTWAKPGLKWTLLNVYDNIAILQNRRGGTFETDIKHLVFVETEENVQHSKRIPKHRII